MDTSEYQNIYKNESKHFFYKANHALVLNLVRTNTRAKDLKILDAGCGTGLLAKKLKIFGSVVGVDMHPEAVRLSKRRRVIVRKASVEELPFKDSSFDLVVSIDVLYHKAIKDDVQALKEFYRVLKPGGTLILRLPANKLLNLKHDIHVHTRQRYTIHELVKKLRRSEFIIARVTYINASLLPVAVLRQFYEQIFEAEVESSVGEVHSTINKIMFIILSIENLILNLMNLPFGIGIVAVAKKPTF